MSMVDDVRLLLSGALSGDQRACPRLKKIGAKGTLLRHTYTARIFSGIGPVAKRPKRQCPLSHSVINS